jgi:hypothetical protein
LAAAPSGVAMESAREIVSAVIFIGHHNIFHNNGNPTAKLRAGRFATRIVPALRAGRENQGVEPSAIQPVLLTRPSGGDHGSLARHNGR